LAENALKESGYVIRPEKSQNAKKQALRAIDAIIKKMPDLVRKANMRFCLTVETRLLAETKASIQDICTPEERSQPSTLTFQSETAVAGEEQEQERRTDLEFICDPYFFRQLDKFASKHGGTLRIMDTQVVEEGRRRLGINTTTNNNKKGIISFEDGENEEEQSLLRDSLLDFVEVGINSVNPGGDAPGPTTATGSSSSSSSGPPEGILTSTTVQAQKNCSICGTYTEENFRLHVKSERHTVNLKRKGKALPPLSEAEFLEYQLDQEFVKGMDDLSI
jgi:hypothetical protein